MRQTRRRSQACKPVFEPLEDRLLLSVSPVAINLVDHGIVFYDEPIQVAEGMWKVADGPSPDELQILISNNVDAADTTNTDQLWSGGGLGLGLDGNGYIVGVWDGGLVRRSHDEFYDGQTYRVTLKDSGNSADHATHVAGTIGASGADGDATGMASEVEIWSYTSDNDLTEMRTAASSVVVSNHSYGYVRGWTTAIDWGIGSVDTWYVDRYSYTEDPSFGKYDSNANALDDVLYDYPDLLSVWSAGNDRNDEFTNAHGDNTYVTFFSGDPGGGWYTGPAWYLVSNSGVTSAPEIDGNGGTAYEGYDSLSQRQTAKNTLVVGAIDDITVDPYNGGDVDMADFSSWGPTDDGRIKADVVANGMSVYSAFAGADNAYGTMSGTSMSAPNVTGTAVLLIEHYDNLFSELPLAATTKGLLIHTAFDAGNVGPDYSYGWGVVDAAAAANFLTDTTDDTPAKWVQENTYSGSEWTWELYSDGTDPLKASIVWTDPAGTPQGSGLDDETPVLVNDLNVWITGPGGTYYAWTLDPSNPSNSAVRTTGNHLDNVEQVLIDSPTEGIYTIHVGRTGDSFTQDYSLLVSGAAEQTAAPEEVDLLADWDTGASTSDNLTKLDNHNNDNKLNFTVSGTINDAAVTLYNGETEIGTGTGNGGTITITTNGTVDLTDGSHNITARQTVDGKLPSDDSDSLEVTVDTIAPSVPNVPDLQAGSDLGSSSTDNITKDNTPTFDISGVSGSDYFRFYRGTTKISGDYETGSTYTAGTQSDSTYNYSLSAVDEAGNESNKGTALANVKIDTVAPAVSQPDLIPADDTGKEDDDNITKGLTPEFTGTASDANSGLWKVVVASNDSKSGTDSTTPATYSVELATLDEAGSFGRTVTATAYDVAGNYAASSTLGMTVDRTAPVVPDAPDLQAGSDLGSSSTDNITKDNTPTFDVSANPYFRFYRDAGQISGDWETGGTYTPNVQSDGTYDYTVTTVDAAGNESGASPVLDDMIIDTVAPEVSGSPVINDGATQRDSIRSIEFTFDEEVAVTSAALQMYYYNGSSWVEISLSSPTFTQPGNDKARWARWTEEGEGLLPNVDDCHLMARLLSSSNLTDIAGNQIANDEEIDKDLFGLHKLSGDIDGNKSQSVEDINTLFTHFGNNSPYDLTGDGNTDGDDVDELVEVIFVTFYGDANLDGTVNGLDLEFVLANWGQSGDFGWEDGDFKDDDTIDGYDLEHVLANWGATSEESPYELIVLGDPPIWS